MALRLLLFTVRPSRIKPSALDLAGESYLARCGPSFAAEGRVVKTEAAALSAVAEERRRGATAFWIADPGGQVLTTDQFTDKIRTARDSGLRQLILAIGPANGWSATARAAADMRLSLGAMTLPHELAALVLAEQVFRASTILQGHPYHLGH